MNKGQVFAVLRSRRKLLAAFNEPAPLAASLKMKFKRSGNELVIYEPKQKHLNATNSGGGRLRADSPGL